MTRTRTLRGSLTREFLNTVNWFFGLSNRLTHDQGLRPRYVKNPVSVPVRIYLYALTDRFRSIP